MSIQNRKACGGEWATFETSAESSTSKSEIRIADPGAGGFGCVRRTLRKSGAEEWATFEMSAESSTSKSEILGASEGR